MRFRHAAIRTGVAAAITLATVGLTVHEQPDDAPAAAAPRAPITAPRTPSPPPAVTPAPSPSASARARARARASREIRDYLEDRAGRVSAAVRDLETGATYSYGSKVRTATASIVKVNILMALLLKAQRAHRRLSPYEKSLAAQMIQHSDNGAASVLWNSIGGGGGLDKANRKLGLRHTTAGPGGAWGSTTTSAADQLRLLGALTSERGPLSAKHRDYVLDLMKGVVDDQAWGVSAAAEREGSVALKNGWLPRRVDGGAWTVNSIGRISDDGADCLVAVISAGHPSLSAGVATVERVATLATRAVRPGRGDG
ncbi:serine hydrolase [Actinomadura fulvescens]|uniref:Beta-lactamase class A catalytic domain-containing protein n=1 Tax=Actinomadura fulvescens TaxID=46160 RepID=A0ABP6C6A4_9ACTN